MPANVPFLAKFAQSSSQKKDKSNAGTTPSRNGTLITKVSRETTDDR